MKYRFITKWCILILSISFNLQFIQCLSDNSRSKKTIQSVNLQTNSDYADNVDVENEQNDSLNDYEDTDVVKKHVSFHNNVGEGDNNDISFRDTHERDSKFVRQAPDEIELAKSELQKVEKNVENEILNLEKLYKIEKVGVKRQINNNGMAKIHVEAHNNDNKLIRDYSNVNQEKNRPPLSVASTSSDDTNKNQFSSTSKQLVRQKLGTPLTNNKEEDDDMERIETAIQKKIDAIMIKVKRQIAKEQENKMIRRKNARYDDLQRMNSVKIQSPNLNKSLKSSTNSGSSLGQRNTGKRFTSIHKKNIVTKSITKNGINYYKSNKMKKSIGKPEKALVSIKNEYGDLERQLQLTSLKSKGLGNRLTRRLRIPPGVSKNFHRSSRRLRKPPGIKLTSLENTPDNQNIETRQVMKVHKPGKNLNFLFHKKSQRAASKRTPKQKDTRQKINYWRNGKKFGERTKRIADNLLDETNFNSVADSDGFDNVDD